MAVLTFIFLLVISSLVYVRPNEVKLVGGMPAYPGEFPYQVSLRAADFGHICGGAILSPDLIVTAAACTDPRSPPITEIVAGTLFRVELFPGQQVRSPRVVVPHPDYDGTFLHNDIALIFLNESLEFNQYISSIELPKVYVETYPKQVVLTGWGNEQYGLLLADFLLKVTLDTYSDSSCEIWTETEVRPEILCTGKNESGFGACQGDAGTPIVTISDPVYLAAVDSHFPCPRPDCCGIPGPTEQSPEISFYKFWILDMSDLHGGGLERP